MAITESLGIVASFTTAGGKVLSKRSNNLVIMDTSRYDVIINITKDWLTTAAASKYGTLYVKPTINVYNEILKRVPYVDESLNYLVVVDADVAVVADNEAVGAIHLDHRVVSGITVDVECYGLLLGRGGMGAGNGFAFAGILSKGQAGGPAANSRFGTLNIRVHGGLSGGAGGGGGRGAVYKRGWYSTAHSEYWFPDTGQPIAGSGAPFGLRMGTITQGHSGGGTEEFFYKNPTIVKTFEEAPAGAKITFPANEYVLEDYNGVGIMVDLTAMIVEGYLDSSSNVNIVLNKPIVELPDILKTFKETNPTLTRLRLYNFEYANDEHLIKESRAYLHAKYGPEEQRYAYSTGARVDNTGAAGLFRGAQGAVPGRLNSGGIERFLCCSSQAVVDRVAQRLRGAKGGDLGQSLGMADALQPVTVHAGYYNGAYRFEILDGLVGWDHEYNKPVSETWSVLPPTTGGVSGPNSKTLNSGVINITAVGSGAIGGAAVLAKYDPNGTYDTLARGSDVLKTFKPRWYREFPGS